MNPEKIQMEGRPSSPKYQHRCLDCGKNWQFRNIIDGLFWIPFCWYHFFFACKGSNNETRIRIDTSSSK